MDTRDHSRAEGSPHTPHCPTCRCSAELHVYSAAWSLHCDRSTPEPELDAHIAQLEEHVRGLKEQRNHRAHVFRLPPEILLEVFRCLALPKDRNLSASQSLGQKWILFSHVCRRWRSQALSNTALWANLDVSASLAFTEAMILRSKSAPLTIMSTGTGICGSGVLPRIFEEMPRVTSIEVNLSLIDMRRFAALLTTAQNAMSLIKMCAHVKPISRTWEFPIQRLVQTAQRLRALELSGCSVDLEVPFLNRLVRLDLQDIPENALFTTSSILQYLAAMPEVKILRLRNVFPLDPQAVHTHMDPNQGPVALRQLQHLTLSAPSSILIVLLPRLVIPASADIFLVNRGTGGGSGDLISRRDTLSAMVTQYASRPAQYRAVLEVSPSKLTMLCIQANRTTDMGRRTLAVFGAAGAGDAEFEDVVNTLGPTLALVPIRILTIKATYISVESWITFFSFVRSAELLFIMHCPSMRPLLHALGTHVAGLDAEIRTVPLPNVRVLKMRNVFIPDYVDDVRRMLAARSDVVGDRNINRLCFENYGGRDRAEVEELVAQMKHTRWVGDEDVQSSRPASEAPGDDE